MEQALEMAGVAVLGFLLFLALLNLVKLVFQRHQAHRRRERRAWRKAYRHAWDLVMRRDKHRRLTDGRKQRASD